MAGQSVDVISVAVIAQRLLLPADANARAGQSHCVASGCNAHIVGAAVGNTRDTESAAFCGTLPNGDACKPHKTDDTR